MLSLESSLVLASKSAFASEKTTISHFTTGASIGVNPTASESVMEVVVISVIVMVVFVVIFVVGVCGPALNVLADVGRGAIIVVVVFVIGVMVVIVIVNGDVGLCGKLFDILADVE